MAENPEPGPFERPPGSPPVPRGGEPASGTGPGSPAAGPKPPGVPGQQRSGASPASPAHGGGPGAPSGNYAPPPKRSSSQIRADIEEQREQLGQSVDHLKERVTELTDWRGQLRKHRKKVVVGAVATGFVVGGLMALRRR
jgi:Protein of unknown function (DUF3618)